VGWLAGFDYTANILVAKNKTGASEDLDMKLVDLLTVLLGPFLYAQKHCRQMNRSAASKTSKVPKIMFSGNVSLLV
jgi:hypothetical protein